MNIAEKYNLKRDNNIIYKLAKETQSGFDELYIKENGKLRHIATEPSGFSILLTFLKKYRKNPELLPKNIKHDYPREYISSEDIYNAMKLMLKPMNTFEEFKERLLLATKEITAIKKRTDISRFGEKLVFINKKEDCGRGINIYGELIPMLQKSNQTYWEYDAVLFNKEKKILECYYKDERINDTPDRSNWKLNIKFYEEQHLYEYLLNQVINAVV